MGPKVFPSKKVLRSFVLRHRNTIGWRSRNCQELNDYVEGAVDPKGRHVEIISGPDARNKRRSYLKDIIMNEASATKLKERDTERTH